MTIPAISAAAIDRTRLADASEPAQIIQSAHRIEGACSTLRRLGAAEDLTAATAAEGPDSR